MTADGVAAVMDRWPFLSDVQLSYITPSAWLLSALPRQALHKHELHCLDLSCTTVTVEVDSGLAQPRAPLVHLQFLHLKSCNLERILLLC